MDDPAVRTLLDAVRRHLWRDQALLAIRRAGWLAAASMLVAVVAHLAALSVPVGALLFVIGLQWMSMLAWVVSRRPSDAACALWIDRHLGGACAFTTLLDTTSGSQSPGHAQAVLWLRQWVAAKAPEVLRSLGERRSSVPVSRSLLSMSVCSALAIFVLMLPDVVPSLRRQAGATSASSAGAEATPAIEAPVAAQLASEISSALRSTESQGEPERSGASAAPAAGATRPEDGSGSPTPASGATLPADSSTAGDSRSAPSVNAAATAGSSSGSADAVSGREAGDSPDTRADIGVSRAPRGTIPGPRSRSRVRLAAADRQADMEQSAAFDESLSMSGVPMPGAAPAAVAATPPPAVETARLSPTETTYVQAWMKATGRSR